MAFSPNGPLGISPLCWDFRFLHVHSGLRIRWGFLGWNKGLLIVKIRKSAIVIQERS